VAVLKPEYPYNAASTLQSNFIQVPRFKSKKPVKEYW